MRTVALDAGSLDGHRDLLHRVFESSAPTVLLTIVVFVWLVTYVRRHGIRGPGDGGDGGDGDWPWGHGGGHDGGHGGGDGGY